MTTIFDCLVEEFTPDHPNFRSKICRHWLKGWCNRGASCNFAHGFLQVKKKKPKSIASIAVEIIHKMELGNKNSAMYNSMEDLVDGYEIIHKEALDGMNMDINVDINVGINKGINEDRNDDFIDI